MRDPCAAAGSAAAREERALTAYAEGAAEILQACAHGAVAGDDQAVVEECRPTVGMPEDTVEVRIAAERGAVAAFGGPAASARWP